MGDMNPSCLGLWTFVVCVIFLCADISHAQDRSGGGGESTTTNTARVSNSTSPDDDVSSVADMVKYAGMWRRSIASVNTCLYIIIFLLQTGSVID